jgi:hypothetical protein
VFFVFVRRIFPYKAPAHLAEPAPAVPGGAAPAPAADHP